MLIKLRRCAGWSAHLLFAYGINRFSHDVAQIIHMGIRVKGKKNTHHDVLWVNHFALHFFYIFCFFICIFFLFGFYGLSRLFHSFDFEPSQSLGGAKMGDLRENPHDHPQTELGSSHRWPELGSNPQWWDDERFKALKINVLKPLGALPIQT